MKEFLKTTGFMVFLVLFAWVLVEFGFILFLGYKHFSIKDALFILGITVGIVLICNIVIVTILMPLHNWWFKN